MKFEVIREIRFEEGEKRIWYVVEPKNKISKFFHRAIPLNYDPYTNREEAIRAAKLKSKGKWDKVVSRKRVEKE